MGTELALPGPLRAVHDAAYADHAARGVPWLTWQQYERWTIDQVEFYLDQVTEERRLLLADAVVGWGLDPVYAKRAARTAGHLAMKLEFLAGKLDEMRRRRRWEV